MKPKPHQRKVARKLVARLLKYGIAILAGEVRSGKTLAFILACQKLNLTNVLIITKKDAIPGIKAVAPESFTITNFHQVKNLPTKEYQLVVIDEFHRYVSSASPKCTKKDLWKEINEVTHYTPIIFSSGTPTPETYASIYSPLALSCKSPFNHYKNFTAWHNDYGIPYDIIIEWDQVRNRPKRKAKGYDKAQTTKIQKAIEHLKVTITQAEAGHKYFAKDKLHNIELSDEQKNMYKLIDKDKMIELEDDYTILADTAAKVLQKKHQISGGFVNSVYDFDETQTKIIQLQQLPKVQYIKDNFDVYNTVIFAFYKAEQEYLSTIFPNVESITKKSDGCDYSHMDNMVIYSFGFHAVTYEQIRARQMNFSKRTKDIIVNFLISGIDEYVYTAVSNKKNFTASWYKKVIYI